MSLGVVPVVVVTLAIPCPVLRCLFSRALTGAILAVPLCECLVEHFCTSPAFPIALLG